MTRMVLLLIDTEANGVLVYPSSESLTGDLEVYDVDDGVFQVYHAQARYLPLTWQAPDPCRRARPDASARCASCAPDAPQAPPALPVVLAVTSAARRQVPMDRSLSSISHAWSSMCQAQRRIRNCSAHDRAGSPRAWCLRIPRRRHPGSREGPRRRPWFPAGPSRRPSARTRRSPRRSRAG